MKGKNGKSKIVSSLVNDNIPSEVTGIKRFVKKYGKAVAAGGAVLCLVVGVGLLAGNAIKSANTDSIDPNNIDSHDFYEQGEAAYKEYTPQTIELEKDATGDYEVIAGKTTINIRGMGDIANNELATAAAKTKGVENGTYVHYTFKYEGEDIYKGANIDVISRGETVLTAMQLVLNENDWSDVSFDDIESGQTFDVYAIFDTEETTVSFVGANGDITYLVLK